MTGIAVSRTLNAVGSPGASTTTDAALLSAIAQGGRDALAMLYLRHAPWLILRLSRRCPDAGLVDEVVQDTFVAVWRGAARWDSRGEVAAWIWGIAVRRLIDALRRQPKVAVLSLNELPDYDGGVESSAEEQAMAGGEFGDLAAALRRLPADLRAVVRATALDGLTMAEAAQLLGIPTGTVKTRMMRARLILRKELT